MERDKQKVLKLGFIGHRNVTVDHRWMVWIKTKFRRYPIWIHGGANGFDTQVDRFAKQYGIQTEVFLPEYDKYPSKTAPLTRNRQIATESDMMIFAWDGRSYGGTFYTMRYTSEIGVPFFVVPVDKVSRRNNKQLYLNF